MCIRDQKQYLHIFGLTNNRGITVYLRHVMSVFGITYVYLIERDKRLFSNSTVISGLLVSYT